MQRPLSPHLQIYSPQLTSILSILHRITGVFLVFFAVLCVSLVYYLSMGEVIFGKFITALSHPFIKFMVCGIFFCLAYHFFNGIRYLIWSNGTGLDLKHYYWSGYVVLALALGSTLFFGVSYP